MSIEKLEVIRNHWYYYNSSDKKCLNDFMLECIDTFKDIRKQLAKKEDVIDVSDIKEVKIING